VIWLSDGEVANASARLTAAELKQLAAMGAEVRAIVFGRGKTEFLERSGLTPSRAAGPAQLVESFTDAFRGIVKAPYKVHAPVATQPQFEMKRWIDEAWIVVYGDTTLGAVSLETPNGKVDANYAQEVWATAGAYKVAHLDSPAPGKYKVNVAGGGPNVTYGVVQRSSVKAYYLGPSEGATGVPIRVVAGLRALPDGPEIPESEFGEKVQMTLHSGGESLTMYDDGSNGDEKAGDGRYSAMLTLREAGDSRVEITAKNSFLNQSATGTIRATGHFRCRRCEEIIDFGAIRAGGSACRDLALDAEREGILPFQIVPLLKLPPGHSFELQAGKARSSHLKLEPSDSVRVCLSTGRDAPNFVASGEKWAAFSAEGRTSPGSRVEIRMRWRVEALSFWERWGWLILLLLGLALLTWIAYGYIRPFRFARELAISFAPEYADLDDQTPQPLKQWRDIRIGFYRNAKAYFRPDFRITGKKSGAIALLEAGPNRSAFAFPSGGYQLFRETSDGDWEAVPPAGRRVQNGEVYRVGEGGPHIRVTARLAR
jgi:hypothetical protein